MTEDPRLRLIGGPDGRSPHAADVLARLDGTRVVIRTGPDMTGAHTVALAAFVGLVARLFGHVALDPPVPLSPNWWGAVDSDALLTALLPVRPTPTAPPVSEVTVTFGNQVAPGHLAVGGDDYTVRLARVPQPLGDPAGHALGVHAAACLAVSQLLGEVLGPVGHPGVRLEGLYVTNLIDYRLTAAPSLSPVAFSAPLSLAVAGVGSVGTSAAALLAGCLAPALAPDARPAGGQLFELIAVDSDILDPSRNPFRYPALLGTESGHKATWLAERLNTLGLTAHGVPTPVAEWTRARDRPGFDGLLLSSVDTLAGRLDVTDVLARETLSLGVAGLALHAQRERFADGLACPFCDYVSAAPPLTQAGAHAETTGLPVTRILALLQPDGRLTPLDVDLAIQAGRLPAERRERLIGAPLTDLVRQAYAEMELRGPIADDGVLAVAAPQISWFAGVLAAVEVIKQLRGLPLVDRRVDADLAGLPPGLVRRSPADSTGRCLCHSGVRRRWYRGLYTDQPAIA
ncbi:hypothetical protein GCM10023328_11570 [Modestobacter marinus]|uniref:Uncharacterized protein n=1 Tax=Modestobacter marinus TaxID=477641 RepID=A0A846LUR6_9ACTN|nr:hypothetical protein [Modestobacter marinus]NIH69208.1 hypothetical protein [Modestobacter marinus]GGL76668.1 hypothetical protein GCM10011589_35920 [Modestobacter marinus]